MFMQHRKGLVMLILYAIDLRHLHLLILCSDILDMRGDELGVALVVKVASFTQYNLPFFLSFLLSSDVRLQETFENIHKMKFSLKIM